ncbi:hypothetical protein Spith_1753 [Spirochaeta thermophila DSM 6578]|uniref:Uncharacterized protein n=1 Tax=Winmispira thermophila (strain ATCC 700085 / DSM 6578 / Z-1203) TaxID=869211 RepID=G0GC02_WINT7|nr:hypothetical protein Spith_1753 [Spirochaeta thermophila DSM 6578]
MTPFGTTISPYPFCLDLMGAVQLPALKKEKPLFEL